MLYSYINDIDRYFNERESEFTKTNPETYKKSAFREAGVQELSLVMQLERQKEQKEQFLLEQERKDNGKHKL
jgi:hypothetical protein